MLEIKTAVTSLLYALGIPITFLGVIENYGTWKGNVLFILAGILLALRIVYLAIEKNQQVKKRKMDLERQRFELDKDKKHED